MRERVEGLGGILTLQSDNQVGTTVQAQLPLIGSDQELGHQNGESNH